MKKRFKIIILALKCYFSFRKLEKLFLEFIYYLINTHKENNDVTDQDIELWRKENNDIITKYYNKFLSYKVKIISINDNIAKYYFNQFISHCFFMLDIIKEKKLDDLLKSTKDYSSITTN